jgi:hypothetical protein
MISALGAISEGVRIHVIPGPRVALHRGFYEYLWPARTAFSLAASGYASLRSQVSIRDNDAFCVIHLDARPKTVNRWTDSCYACARVGSLH